MWRDNKLGYRIARKQIDAIIASNPIIVVLIRGKWIDDNAGGKYRAENMTIESQVGILIHSASTTSFQLRENEDGKMVKADNVLVLPYDADVKKGDYFTNRGLKHEILWVHVDKREAKRCEVMVHG